MRIEVNKRNGVQVSLFWPRDDITAEELREFIRPYCHVNAMPSRRSLYSFSDAQRDALTPKHFDAEVAAQIEKHEQDMAAGAAELRQAHEDLLRAEYEGMTGGN